MSERRNLGIVVQNLKRDETVTMNFDELKGWSIFYRGQVMKSIYLGTGLWAETVSVDYKNKTAVIRASRAYWKYPLDTP